MIPDEKLESLRKFLGQQFELHDVDVVDDLTYYFFEFNTLLNVAGDGDFKIAITEDAAGTYEVVDYVAGRLR